MRIYERKAKSPGIIYPKNNIRERLIIHTLCVGRDIAREKERERERDGDARRNNLALSLSLSSLLYVSVHFDGKYTHACMCVCVCRCTCLSKKLTTRPSRRVTYCRKRGRWSVYSLVLVNSPKKAAFIDSTDVMYTF